MSTFDEKWVLCPICGAKTRLQLLQRTVLLHFPLFCPKCRKESIINAQNVQTEIIDQPDAKTQC
ncbi:MAG: cysteine-rich KTR domain-containing protein [Ruminococcus bromii]|nr:cysteine-rich KTR domain-containing protein [Ruminococcus bromii]MDD6433810.1 cysteine-rich KTR domain-containing protein [Ruminococcus bromii]